MAIGWVTLLKTVPWADVIASAPTVADGAKKLWKAVGKKNTAAPETDAAARLQSLEATVTELQNQMLASSELLTALTEQNAELIKCAEANRVRLLWLYGAVVGLFVLLLLLLGAAYLR